MAPRFFVALIDGTGPYSDEQYERDFTFSFLSQLSKQLGKSQSAYFPGPGTLGFTSGLKADAASEAIYRIWASDKSCKIFVAGYSRGGAAAIEVAKKCAKYPVPHIPSAESFKQQPWQYPYSDLTKIPIEALLLLDPVSKDVTAIGGDITDNVKQVYVMYRDQTILEYSPKLDTQDFDSYVDKSLCLIFNAVGKNDPDRYARKFMMNAPVTLAAGNATTRVYLNGGTKLVIKNASHGAIGGLPWIERRDDEQAARTAASLFNGWLNQNHIPGMVRDMSYTEASKRQYVERQRAFVEHLRQQAQESERTMQIIRHSTRTF